MSDRHSISPYPVRMPHDLRDLLEASAKEGSRSLHAEIISRLWSTFNKKDLVRRKLGLPLADPEDEALQDDRSPSEVSKEKLLSGLDIQASAGEQVVLSAILKALRDSGSTIQISSPLDTDKPKPNTGPKPRKPYGKK